MKKTCPECNAAGRTFCTQEIINRASVGRYMAEQFMGGRTPCTQEEINRSLGLLVDSWINIDDYDKCPICQVPLNKLSEISAENIKNILKYLPLFETAEPESLYKYPAPTKNKSGKTIFSFDYIYAPEVNEFVRALYKNNFIVPFNWGDWEEGKKYFRDPVLIQNADIEDLQKLLTAVVRNERFFAGALANAIESGDILAILKSLKSKINS